MLSLPGVSGLSEEPPYDPMISSYSEEIGSTAVLNSIGGYVCYFHLSSSSSAKASEDPLCRVSRSLAPVFADLQREEKRSAYDC